MLFRRMHGKLDLIISLLNLVITQGTRIMAAIDDLQADVSAEDTVIASVVTLLQGFATQLANAGVDPTKLAALRSDIQSHTQSLAAAVAANTPATTFTPSGNAPKSA